MFLSAWVCSDIDEYRKALFSSRLLRFLVALLVVPALQLISAAFLPAYAGDTALLAADNTLILTSSALVLLMTPGLAFFYGGFVQSRNVLNTMAMSFVMMGIATLVWVTFGFSLAFSDGGAFQAVVGNPFSFALLENVPPVWDGLAIPGLTFALFQGMFAIITPALISGALVERISFKFWCVFSPIWLLLVYAPLAHMVWGGGFLGKDLDFAGGTVVHISSGVSALVLAGLVGSRRQWPHSVRPPHDVSQILLGTDLLWFGWFGFNGGSQLALGSASNAIDISAIFVNTNMAAAGGVVAAMVFTQLVFGKVDLTIVLNGAIGGLVSITAEPLTPSISMAILIGAIGGLLIPISVMVLDKLKIDDVVGAIPAHLVCGIWGTMAVPLTNSGTSFGSQLLGVVSIGAFVIVTSTIAWAVLKYTIGIRVSDEDETVGLDKTELGMEAYPEFTRS